MTSTTTITRPLRTGIIAGAVALATLAGVLAISELRSDGQGGGTVTAPLADGRHFGRLTAAYVAPDEVLFDPAQLLEGEAAREAAIEDGVPADEIGDFYIRDDDGEALSLPVSTAVVVTTVDCSGSGCVEGAAGDYGTLTRTVADTPGSYWLVVEDGVVVEIDEQYLP
jgi:hypothetical protein